jgi:hypothetical protein
MSQQRVTIVATGAGLGVLPGLWSIGNPHETDSGIYSVPLLHMSEDEPVHVWTMSKAEFIATDPEKLVWQIPQPLRQKYVGDQSVLERSLARLQLSIQKPWRAILEKTKELRPDDLNKRGAELAKYIEELKLRILGAQTEAVAYGSLDELYDELVNYYKSTLSLDELTPYLLASFTLLTHQTPNLDFIFQVYISGLKGSGKSTAGERLEKVCYQGFKTGCATFPFLVRANEVLGGMTQVLDEFDLIANDEHVTKYLRGSTDRANPYGLVEPVTIGGQTHNMPAIKMSFGPRVLITSQQIRDEMVRDRALEVVMMQYPGYLPEPDPEVVDELREHLAYYRQNVRLNISPEDKRRWYDTKNASGRLNETSTLLHVVTPQKYHDEVAAIIQREWETRTQLERESYAAKIVEGLTAAVLAEDTVESTTAQIYVPIAQIKRHFDMLYSDLTTGKGKASPKSIGRVIRNLGLRTDNIRVKDQDQRLRAWLLDKVDLVRIRQSLYLDEVPDLGTSGTSGTSPSVLSSIDKIGEGESEHTRSNVPNVPNVPRTTPLDFSAQAEVTRKLTTYGYMEGDE